LREPRRAGGATKYFRDRRSRLTSSGRRSRLNRSPSCSNLSGCLDWRGIALRVHKRSPWTDKTPWCACRAHMGRRVQCGHEEIFGSSCASRLRRSPNERPANTLSVPRGCDAHPIDFCTDRAGSLQQRQAARIVSNFGHEAIQDFRLPCVLRLGIRLTEPFGELRSQPHLQLPLAIRVGLKKHQRFHLIIQKEYDPRKNMGIAERGEKSLLGDSRNCSRRLQIQRVKSRRNPVQISARDRTLRLGRLDRNDRCRRSAADG
jgi:hypothetical protein